MVNIHFTLWKHLISCLNLVFYSGYRYFGCFSWKHIFLPGYVMYGCWRVRNKINYCIQFFFGSLESLYYGLLFNSSFHASRLPVIKVTLWCILSPLGVVLGRHHFDFFVMTPHLAQHCHVQFSHFSLPSYLPESVITFIWEPVCVTIKVPYY